MLIRSHIPDRRTVVIGFLLIGCIVVEERYYHWKVAPISICRFQSGLCAEGASVHLEEGRLNLRSLLILEGDIPVTLSVSVSDVVPVSEGQSVATR